MILPNYLCSIFRYFYDSDFGCPAAGSGTVASSTTSAATPLRPMPERTHVSHVNEIYQQKFHNFVESRNVAGLEDLLSAHSHLIDINRYDSVGRTPLQHFCSAGELALVKLLVRYGADTQLRSRDGWSAVHYATFSGVQDVLLYVIRCSRR